MSIKLAQHLFGIVLILLPIGLFATLFTHNGAWFAASIILAIETVILSILYTVYRTRIKK
jgi:hypothetical protein